MPLIPGTLKKTLSGQRYATPAVGSGLLLRGATSGSSGIVPAAAGPTIKYTLPDAAPASDGYVLSSTTVGVLSWIASGGGITIDTTAITGGAANRILFESATNKVSESANLTFGTTNTGLAVTADAATTVPWRITLAAAQSANAFEIKSSSAVNQYTQDSDGDSRWRNASTGAIEVSVTDPWIYSTKKQIFAEGGVGIGYGDFIFAANYFMQMYVTYPQFTDQPVWNCVPFYLGARNGSLEHRMAYHPVGSQLMLGRGSVVHSSGYVLTSTSPNAEFSIHSGSGSGTNIIGSNISLCAGRSTGSGTPGVINLKTAPAGGSGSSLNALATALQIDASVTATHTRMLLYDVDSAALQRVKNNGSILQLDGVAVAPDFSGDVTFSALAVYDTEDDNSPTGTTHTVDWTLGNNQKLDVSGASGDVTVSFTDPPLPCHLMLKVVQGGTARDLTWPAEIKWDDVSGEPTWNADTNKTRLVGLYWDGTNYWTSASDTYT